MHHAWLNERCCAGFRSLDHRNLSRLHVIRQTNELRALLDEGRLPESSDVFAYTVLDPVVKRE